MSINLISWNFSGNPEHLSWLFELYYMFHLRSGDTHSKFYCGITNDPIRRAKEHNVKSFLVCKEMKNAELAKRAERLLGKKGFDIGKKPGNGKEDSLYVYMYRKIPFVTIEHLEDTETGIDSK